MSNPVIGSDTDMGLVLAVVCQCGSWYIVEQLRMERTSRWHLDDAGKWINSNPEVWGRVFCPTDLTLAMHSSAAHACLDYPSRRSQSQQEACGCPFHMPARQGAWLDVPNALQLG